METLQHYKQLLPKKVTVITTKTDNGFVAEIKEFPNCYTQADNFPELIEMVNDAIFTYLDIPQKYIEKIGIVYLPLALVKEIKRLRFEDACKELTKEISASKATYRRTSLTY